MAYAGVRIVLLCNIFSRFAINQNQDRLNYIERCLCNLLFRNYLLRKLQWSCAMQFRITFQQILGYILPETRDKFSKQMSKSMPAPVTQTNSISLLGHNQGRRSHLEGGAEKNSTHYGLAPRKIMYFTSFHVT